MKKHFQISFMALFMLLAMTMVSCGKEDDEPDNGSGGSQGQSITLTLDGKKYTFNSGVTTLDSDEILIELFNSNFTPWINFVFYEPKQLSNGMVLKPDMDFSNGMGPVVLSIVNYNNLSAGGYTLESGSVKINSINLNAKKLEVTFNNALFEEFVYGKKSVTVNGSFSVPLNSTWGVSN